MYNFMANYPKAPCRPGSRARETSWKVEREKEKRMVLEENRLAEREYSRHTIMVAMVIMMVMVVVTLNEGCLVDKRDNLKWK